MMDGLGSQEESVLRVLTRRVCEEATLSGPHPLFSMLREISEMGPDEITCLVNLYALHEALEADLDGNSPGGLASASPDRHTVVVAPPPYQTEIVTGFFGVTEGASFNEVAPWDTLPLDGQYELGSDQVPTVGSWAHHEGSCKPCAYTGEDGPCRNGRSCRYCHLCQPAGKQTPPAPPTKIPDSPKSIEPLPATTGRSHRKTMEIIEARKKSAEGRKPLHMECLEGHLMTERVMADGDQATCDRCRATADGGQLWMVCVECEGWCLCPECTFDELKAQAGVTHSDDGGGECPTCRMVLNGPQQLKDHFTGKKHVTNMRKKRVTNMRERAPAEGPEPEVRIWDTRTQEAYTYDEVWRVYSGWYTMKEINNYWWYSTKYSPILDNLKKHEHSNHHGGQGPPDTAPAPAG